MHWRPTAHSSNGQERGSHLRERDGKIQRRFSPPESLPMRITMHVTSYSRIAEELAPPLTAAKLVARGGALTHSTRFTQLGSLLSRCEATFSSICAIISRNNPSRSLRGSASPRKNVNCSA